MPEPQFQFGHPDHPTPLQTQVTRPVFPVSNSVFPKTIEFGREGEGGDVETGGRGRARRFQETGVAQVRNAYKASTAVFRGNETQKRAQNLLFGRYVRKLGLFHKSKMQKKIVSGLIFPNMPFAGGGENPEPQNRVCITLRKTDIYIWN